MYEAFKIDEVHRRTGKHLLHVEFKDAPEGSAWMIHPERAGARALSLAVVRGPVLIPEELAEQYFTPAQLRLYHQLDLAATEEAAQQERTALRALPVGVRAHWVSTRLTFIKSKIDPLAPDEVFAVEVLGEATYAMSRRQFEEAFANVVASRAYSEYGSYNYKPTPSRATEFIIR